MIAAVIGQKESSIPQTIEKRGEVLVTIGKSSYPQECRLIIPSINNGDNYEAWLADEVDRLRDKDFYLPQNHSPVEISQQKIIIVISEVELDPMAYFPNLLHHIKVAKAPQNLNSLGQILSLLAQQSWRRDWPKLRTENLLRGRHYTCLWYLATAYYLMARNLENLQVPAGL